MLQDKIENWLLKITNEGDLPSNCEAIYIGLFENKEYMVHFLGSTKFDKNNDDWACEGKKDYFPQNRYLSTGISTDNDWKVFLNEIIVIIKELKNNKNLILNQTPNIAIGFDGGDLFYISK